MLYYSSSDSVFEWSTAASWGSENSLTLLKQTKRQDTAREIYEKETNLIVLWGMST